jgi:hypothetical protein
MSRVLKLMLIVLASVLLVVGGLLWALPEIVRRVALARIPKLTGRAADHRGHRPQSLHRTARHQELSAGRSPGPRTPRGGRAARRPAVAGGAAPVPRSPRRDRADRAVGPRRAHGARRVQLLRPPRDDEGASAEPRPEPLDGDGGAPQHRARSRAGRRPSRVAGGRVAGGGPRGRGEGPHDAGRGGARPADGPGPDQRGPPRRPRRAVAARSVAARGPGVPRGVRDAPPESVRLRSPRHAVPPGGRTVCPRPHR